jgi:large subunit ribosomal protein L25
MELTVEKRDIKTNTNTLRNSGKLPAVVYGRSEASTPISIDRKTFEKLYKEAGESTIISLKGLGDTKDVLVQEVDFHALTGEPLHADFYAIEKGQKVTVSVPFEFEGVSPAVKDQGGILVKVMHELEIECEPRDLPQHIVVDVSALTNLDSQIKISDLNLPKSATFEVDADEVVAMITVAQDEPIESAPMDLSAIETSVERGKKEEEAPAEGESKE